MVPRVVRMDRSREADFFRLHAESNGCAWCFCSAWWVPTWEGWGKRTAAENRAVREALFARGEHDGYLLYEGEEPAGWCQAGPRDRLVKLTAQLALAPDPSAWAITCFLIAPAARRRGLASHLLDEVISDLRARGAARVEAYPKRLPEADAAELWNGPEAMFRAAGFQLLRDDPKRPVYGMDLSGRRS